MRRWIVICIDILDIQKLPKDNQPSLKSVSIQIGYGF